MDMHQIRYFLAVCETLNFTRAAERCGVTQPALTRAVQRLEEELGGLLLRRERRRTHLTDLGRLMRERLELVLRATGEAQTTARSFLNLDTAALNVGVMCTIGPLRFTAFLQELQARERGLDIAMHDGTLDELRRRLDAGGLDVAILAQPDPFESRLETVPIYRENFVAGFAKGHRLEALDRVPLQALHGESYLARLNCEFRDRLGEIHEARGVRARICYRSAREEWIQAMAAAGLGICLIPQFSPVVPGLVTRPLSEPAVIREVCLVTVRGRRLSSAASRFITAARAHRWPGAEFATTAAGGTASVLARGK